MFSGKFLGMVDLGTGRWEPAAVCWSLERDGLSAQLSVALPEIRGCDSFASAEQRHGKIEVRWGRQTERRTVVRIFPTPEATAAIDAADRKITAEVCRESEERLAANLAKPAIVDPDHDMSFETWLAGRGM